MEKETEEEKETMPVSKFQTYFEKYYATKKGIGRGTTMFDYEIDIKKEAQIKDFNTWLDQQGVEHPKVAYPVFFHEAHGFSYPGFVALEQIDPQEAFVTVPYKLIMENSKAFLINELAEIFEANPGIFTDFSHSSHKENIIITFLLFEKQKGKDSFWHPFINCLPSDCDKLFDWDDEELDELQDSTLVEEARKEYSYVCRSWNYWYAALKQYPKVFREETISFGNYKWAYSVCLTRLFSGPNEESILVPFADCVNHENVNVTFSRFYQFGSSRPAMGKHKSSITDGFLLKTNDQSFEKGSQVYLSYGELSNKELKYYSEMQNLFSHKSYRNNRVPYICPNI